MATEHLVVNEKSSDSKNKLQVLVAYSGAHPAHQKMLAGLNARSIKMLGEWSTDEHASGTAKLRAYVCTARQLRSADAGVIIIEGTTPSIIMAPIIKFLNRRPISIIALCTEDGLYRAFVADGGLRATITHLSFRFIDGIIAIGDMIAGIAEKHLRPIPIVVRYPEVSEARVESLAELSPSLDSNNLLLIGGRDAHYKGVDIAITSLELLKDRFPDTQLTVLGFPELENRPGLHSPGPVDDIRTYLSSSSVLIHPGRGEGFGLVVIEAMLSGVVPFVSEWTGASSIVRKVDPSLIVPLHAQEFAARITAFWDASPDYRQELSAKCKKVALEYAKEATQQPSLASFIESMA